MSSGTFRSRASHLAPLFLLGGVALAGCGGDGGPADTPASYFDGSEYEAADCNQRDGQLMIERPLDLFQNARGDLHLHTRALQRYYRRHDLTFVTPAVATRADMEYALDTNLTVLEAALEKRFPEIDFSDDDPVVPEGQQHEIDVFVANYVMAPVIKFAQEHGRAGAGRTNVVLLQQLVRRGGQSIVGEGKTLAGLAVSPVLIKALIESNDEQAQLWQDVQLPEGFTPMLFLDGAALDRFAKDDPIVRDLVVAHEFGHTGGLLHRNRPLNLMKPLVTPLDACTQRLDPDQILTLRAAFGLDPPVTVQALQVHDGDKPLTRRQRWQDLRAFLSGRLKGPPAFLRPFLHTW